MKLSNAQPNQVVVDPNTTFMGEPIEWLVAAQDVDGTGITTLMMRQPFTGYCFDAKEPQNPNTYIQNGGYGDYEKSNLIQWLNSDAEAGEWYSPQHEYDFPPESAVVGGTYEKEAGFLNGFSNSLKNSMRAVTKLNISRKVHLPSYSELTRDTNNPPTFAQTNYPIERQDYLDNGTVYLNRMCNNYYQILASQYKKGLLIRTSELPSNFIDELAVLCFTGTTLQSGTWSLVPTDAALKGNGTLNPRYVLPVIYVDSDLPVTYDSGEGKYYISYGLSVQYSDYGAHKNGFNFSVNITSGDTSESTTVRAYLDGSSTVFKTYTVSQYNTYVPLTLTNSDISSLSLGTHTIRLQADKSGAIATSSFVFTKTEDTMPIVLTNDIGNVVQAFTTSYQAYDDDGDSLDAVVKLDGVQIDSRTNIPQHTDIPLSITDSQFNALAYGNHSIVLEVTDGTNTSTVTLLFVKNSVPVIELSSHDLGEVLQPISVTAVYSSADGDNITIKAYIDNQEINA